MKQIFEFTEYKSYLSKRLALASKQQKGAQTRLAEALRCGPAYLTQIFKGKAHLSLDQAEATARFLGLHADETDHFLLLVLQARAATPQLRKHLQSKIHASRESHLDLKKRIPSQEIPEESRAIFYSAWDYLAVLTLLTIPALRTRAALSARLRLAEERVEKILAFLVSCSFAEARNGEYYPGLQKTHLGRASPLIARHHTNWRLQGLRAIEQGLPGNLHYSAAATLSQDDFEKVKTAFTRALEEITAVVVASPAEKPCGICVDFFEL